MTKNRTIQIYRGTTTQNDAYTGSAGELTMDTTTNEIRIHDGSTAGGHKIGAGYHPDLFDVKWADHICDDVPWLRADTFSWQSGAAYQAAYQHLAADITGKTLQSETISGTTIQFYLADDGHKVCPASQESNVTAIYNATGVAWYYIIDTTNQRFKLPRTKFGFTGIRSGVGNYVEAGLPNITGSIHLLGDVDIDSVSGAFTMSGSRNHDRGAGTGITGNASANFSAQNSNSLYGASSTVQPPATQMYLYFYIGAFSQTALENTAGLNAELFNNKADLDLSNLSATGKEKSANLAMPSNSYERITLGASGTTYVAPRNGYVALKFDTDNSGFHYVHLRSAHTRGYTFLNTQNNITGLYMSLPVAKGLQFVVEYGGISFSDVDSFCFYYANGDV